jgi:pyrroloquinoline quinone (PQQ) biosynthesis protein C
MTPMEILNQYPVWKRNTEVTHVSDGVIARRLMREYAFKGEIAKRVKTLIPELDGKRTTREIAAKCDLGAESAAQVIAKLGALGLVGLVGGTAERATISGVEFHEIHRRYCETWLQRVYDHPFWDKVMTGRASRAQIFGFAFEKYHYIEGAHEHMSIAVANATPEMMVHLARHFIEEYTHGDIYRAGLRAYFPDEVVLRSQPLPSTRALLNFLNESAMRNSFSYYAGNELLQATENSAREGEVDEVNLFYAGLLEHYPWAERLVRSFEDHTRLDQKLGHQDVFLEMCRDVPDLTRAQAEDALNTTRLMAEHLVLFMDGVDRYYEARPVVPRVPATLLSI